MIDGSFAFVRGVGPAREKQLRSLGIRRWSDFPEEGEVLSPTLDRAIREAVAKAAPAMDEGRWGSLWDLFPARERWRFIPSLEAEACYLDIETTFDGQVTVIGCYDERRGPRLYVRGHNLGDFVRERTPQAYVTFNGASFDLPVLERTFRGWRAEAPHLDLRQVAWCLKEGGGLKAIEARWGLERPTHLTGLGGAEAPVLWRSFARTGDEASLRRLLEYNLYDVVQLRLVAQIACERLAEKHGGQWRPSPRFDRGDVIADLGRAVEAVVKRAARIDADAFHEEERRSIRR